MWIFLGVIGLVWSVSWIFSGRAAYFPSFDFRTREGQVYGRLCGDKSNQIISVSIPLNIPHAFRIRRERSRDVWAKRWGLSEEIATGDTRFDQAFYIESDSLPFQRALAGSSELRQSIDGLFPRAVSRITSNRKVLTATFIKDVEQEQSTFDEIESTIVPKLYALAAILAKMPAPSDRGWRDTSFRRAAFLTASNYGLIIAGVILYIWGEPLGPTLDFGEIWIWALLRAPLMVLLVGALWWAIMGRSSLRHLVLLEYALVGTAGVVLLTVGIAQSINQNEDSDGTGQKLSLTVHDAYKSWVRGRKGRGGYWVYYVEVPELIGHGGSSHKVRVPRQLFERAGRGTTLILETYAGRLGARWVFDVELLDKSGARLGRWPGTYIKVIGRPLISRILGRD